MKTIITLCLFSILLFFGCEQGNEIISPINESTDQQLKVKSSHRNSDDAKVRNPFLHREDLFTEVDKYPPSADSVFIPINLPETVISSLVKTDIIDGNVGGLMEIYYEFQDSLNNTISIYAKLDFPQDAFVGTEEITMILNNEIGTVSFYPHMEFNQPVEYSVKYTGIDLSGIDLNSVDFIFQNYDGSAEQINYYKLNTNVLIGQLDLQKADLHHFSRYGWIR